MDNDQDEALSDQEVADDSLNDEHVEERRLNKRIRVTQEEMVKDEKPKKAKELKIYSLGSTPTFFDTHNLFWATTKIKTVNGERQLQALVDKKKLIITETSIRSGLHLEDAGGIDCLPTDTIFEELAKMGGEDRLKLSELMDMCTKLTERVIDLEHTKTAQAQEITNFKPRVTKLEKKSGLRTQKFKRLYKVGVTIRVHFSDDDSLGAQEDASNHGRSIEDIDKDAKVPLVDETQGKTDDAEIIADPSTTAVPPPSPVITEVEITLAQTLAKLKSAKSKVVIQEPVQSTATTSPSTIPKAKGITFRDADERTTRTPTSVSSLSIKDKWKAKMDGPEVPLKKKDQIALDEEIG
ncbi:hypothetical protein Tco_0475929 [Tanacetum coccineum]